MLILFRNPFRSVLAITALGVLTNGHAQSLDTSDNSTENSDDIVLLSPFEVNAETNGYEARETLASTRLRTPVRDVAAPISIMTADFLRDIGATNIQDALIYSVNSENENEFAPDDSEGVSIASTTQTRVRGLRSSTQSRGFFTTRFRSDSYNTDAFTIARGPNSVLYGIGSPAGVMNTSLIQARTNKHFNEVSVRFDDNSGHRVSFNTNHPLLGDLLAIRVAAMTQNRSSFKEPEYDKEDRLFATITAKPWKGATFRASWESMENDRVRARSTATIDRVSEWTELGSPLYDSVNQRWTFDGGSTWVAKSDAPELSDFFLARNQRVFIADNSSLDGGFGDSQGLVWNNSTAQSFHENRILHPDRTFSDNSVVSSYWNIFGQSSATIMDGDIYNLTLEQKLTRDLYLEVAYNKEEWGRTSHDTLRGADGAVQADINLFLPPDGDGNVLPNPNVGRYYVQGEHIGAIEDADVESFRATASYELDLRETHKWLGSHKFAAMYQSDTNDQILAKTRVVNLGDYQNGTIDAGTNNLLFRYYLDVPGTLQSDSNGVAYPGYFSLPSASTWPTDENTYATEPSISQRNYEAVLGVLQSRFLDDNLILTFGYREDTETVRTASTLPVDDNGAYLYRDVPVDDTPLSDVTGVTRTLGAVYHTPLKGVSLVYNRSDTFEPQGNYIDWFGNPLPPSSGLGEDYGVSFELFENKLNVRGSYFTNTSINNIETDWFYEQPKWSVVNYMENQIFQWSNVYERYGLPTSSADVNQPEVSDALRATRDFRSSGYEIELHAKPTRNLDVIFTLARTAGIVSNIQPLLQEYIDSRMDVWEKYFPLLTPNRIPASGASSAQLGAQPDWENDTKTIGYQMFKNPIRLPRVAAFEALESAPTTRNRKYRANLIATYRFTEGRFKGLTVGGAFRYRSKASIGYYGMENPLISSAPEVADLSRPIWGDPVFETDAWIRYGRKLRNVDWSIQLNIQNLLNDDDFVAVNAHTDGSILAYAPKAPRSFAITNTFKF